MGCLFVLVLAGISAAMTYLFGYALWVLIVLGSFWVAALVVSAIFGHRGFGGHGNTDLMIVIAGMFVTAAIIVPRYSAKTPCTPQVPPCVQAGSAPAKLAAAAAHAQPSPEAPQDHISDQRNHQEDKNAPVDTQPDFVPAKQPRKTCPQTRYIDCMPPVKEESRKMCSKEYLDWIKKHCPDVEVVY